MISTSKKTKIIVIINSIVVVGLIFFAVYLVYMVESKKGEGDVFVIEVIDGDTFKMNNGETIRLLCIDTPEQNEKGYEEATKFLESLILYKEVKLESGKTLNQTDKYGRTLSFVYVNNLGKDVFINKLMIEVGFSNIYEYGDVEGECKGMVG